MLYMYSKQKIVPYRFRLSLIKCIFIHEMYILKANTYIIIILKVFDSVSPLTFYPTSMLRKMAVFIEKPPVTSANCYKTMKNASILMKLGTHAKS
jgi:hypothetical protein